MEKTSKKEEKEGCLHTSASEKEKKDICLQKNLLQTSDKNFIFEEDDHNNVIIRIPKNIQGDVDPSVINGAFVIGFANNIINHPVI